MNLFKEQTNLRINLLKEDPLRGAACIAADMALLPLQMVESVALGPGVILAAIVSDDPDIISDSMTSFLSSKILNKIAGNNS